MNTLLKIQKSSIRMKNNSTAYTYYLFLTKHREIWEISCSNNDIFSKTYMGHVLHKNGLDKKKSVNHLK